MFDFLDFLKHPVYCRENRRPDLFEIVSLPLSFLFAVMPLALLVIVTTKIFGLSRVQDFTDMSKKLLVVVLLAPVCEEILFRCLLKFTKRNVALFGVVVASLVVYGFINSRVLMPCSLLGILAVLGVFILRNGIQRIELFIESHYVYFFYGVALVFGMVHSSNFTGSSGWLLLLLSPLLGAPQILLGALLGYMRTRFGLVYSILFHIAVNGCVFLIAH